MKIFKEKFYIYIYGFWFQLMINLSYMVDFVVCLCMNFRENDIGWIYGDF